MNACPVQQKIRDLRRVEYLYDGEDEPNIFNIKTIYIKITLVRYYHYHLAVLHTLVLTMVEGHFTPFNPHIELGDKKKLPARFLYH